MDSVLHERNHKWKQTLKNKKLKMWKMFCLKRSTSENTWHTSIGSHHIKMFFSSSICYGMKFKTHASHQHQCHKYKYKFTLADDLIILNFVSFSPSLVFSSFLFIRKVLIVPNLIRLFQNMCIGFWLPCISMNDICVQFSMFSLNVCCSKFFLSAVKSKINRINERIIHINFNRSFDRPWKGKWLKMFHYVWNQRVTSNRFGSHIQNGNKNQYRYRSGVPIYFER